MCFISANNLAICKANQQLVNNDFYKSQFYKFYIFKNVLGIFFKLKSIFIFYF